MANRYELELIVSSAKDLKNVNWRHGSLKPYVVAWVDPAVKLSTKVDHDGDAFPSWNETLVIPIPSRIEDSALYLDVVHFKTDGEDDTKAIVGSARLFLRDVVDDVGLGVQTTRTLELRRPSGRPQGKVEVKVSVRDPRYRAPESSYAPPYVVPPPPGTRGGGYPAPPPYTTPYGAPPPDPYYSYAPPYGQAPYGQPAYGQPPRYGDPAYGQVQYGQTIVEKPKKSGMGMGTGLAVGAVAGVLGGLALAEGVDALEDHIADDVADKVEDDLEYDGDDFWFSIYHLPPNNIRNNNFQKKGPSWAR